jgi:effector-binding domain-containing protein
MKAEWIVLIVVGGVLALGLALYLVSQKSPDLSAYLPLKDPRITRRESERVLEVEFSGPADTVIKEAYSILFKAYFRLKGSPKGPAMKPPKARYQIPASKERFGAQNADEKRLNEFMAHDWTGSVAIPIPDSLTVDERKPDAGVMFARAATWDYGEVAEILHLGPYETEPPTIRRLQDFIDAKGYKVIGDHEEEYLKGPGMPMVQPKDYWTIIRYRVVKSR